MSYYSPYDKDGWSLQLESEKHLHFLTFLGAVIVATIATICILGGIWINSHRVPVDTDVQVHTTEQPK